MFGPFLLGVFVGWLLWGRSASAAGESVQVRNPHPILLVRPDPPPAPPSKTVIRGGCIFPNGEELPPIPRPVTSLVPVLDDPTLSPSQVLALNSKRPSSSGGGWPT